MFWVIAIALLAYFLLDVHYYFRATFTFLLAKVIRKPLTNQLASSEIYGICLPSDADFFFVHMNNGRYLREYDFGRFDLLTRNGSLQKIMKKGGFPVSAITIRYRLPLYVFSLYKVVTTPLWWDEKFLYLDQRVVTLSDNIVRSVGIVKLSMGKVNYEEFVQSLFPGTVKPELSHHLKTWIKANELSSENLKSETKES